VMALWTLSVVGALAALEVSFSYDVGSGTSSRWERVLR
jgi:hypothetical protein